MTLLEIIATIVGAFAAAILVASALLYQSRFDIFALLGTTLHVAALWFGKEKIIRRISLCGSPCWLVYNIASKAYFSAVSDSFAILSMLVAMLRYDLKRKKENA